MPSANHREATLSVRMLSDSMVHWSCLESSSDFHSEERRFKSDMDYMAYYAIGEVEKGKTMRLLAPRYKSITEALSYFAQDINRGFVTIKKAKNSAKVIYKDGSYYTIFQEA